MLAMVLQWWDYEVILFYSSNFLCLCDIEGAFPLNVHNGQILNPARLPPKDRKSLEKREDHIEFLWKRFQQ